MKTITTSASIVSLCALMSAFTASPVMADTALNTDMRQAEGQYGTLDPTQINNHTTPAAAPTNFTIGQKHASSQPDATATPDGATYHATTNMIPGNKSLVNTTTMDTGSNSYFKNYTQAIDTDTVSQPKDATSMKLSPIANMGEYVGCKDGTPPQTVSALSSSFMAKATD